MESYYSSDEEIAWGPVTLREIKSDLKRRAVKKPSRRHTVLCKIQNTQMDDSLSKEVNKLNISGTSTAYYTPNESLKTNSNSDFLEKLTHVISIPSSELSEYASVLEDTKNSNIQSEDGKSQNGPLYSIPHIFVTETNEPCRDNTLLEDTKNSNIQSEDRKSQNRPLYSIPHIFVTEANEPCQDDTCTDFIMALKNRKTHYDIENFQQTLVENSYVLSEEEQINEENGELNNHNNVSLRNKFVMEEEEVIVLSDDSGSSTENCEDVSYDEEITSFKKEYDFEFHKNEISLDECDKISYKTTDRYELYKSGSEGDGEEQQYKVESEFNTGNSIDDIKPCEQVISHQLDDDNFLVTANLQQKLSTIEESLSTSPVVVPEIDLTQFDDSAKDNSLQLNDTMEEINRLLCQGLNYSMSDDEVIENTPVKKELTPQELLTPSNDISSNKQLFSSGKDKTSHIPKRKFIPTSAEKKINTLTVTKAFPKTHFKIPELPRPKLTNPTPPKSCKNLKNIVSPVALYIKNSPRTPLKQNVPQRVLTRIVTTASPKSANKENFVEFPEVVYEPAKKQITSTEKHIVVPPYMRKLNITEGHITKHQGRINCQSNRSEVSNKLLQSDITSSTIDHSLLDDTGDISVLTNKQAFIK